MNQPKGYILTRNLPAIPAKRYFTIGEVSELCDVRSYVLRYWEQEFTQLSPMKRRGNRRYYQLHEVQLVRRIRELLYEQGFTIAGARLQLDQKMAEDVMAFELSPVDLSEHALPPDLLIDNMTEQPIASSDIPLTPPHQAPAEPRELLQRASPTERNMPTLGVLHSQGVLQQLRAISALLQV